jgi:hypothetical protein
MAVLAAALDFVSAQSDISLASLSALLLAQAWVGRDFLQESQKPARRR